MPVIVQDCIFPELPEYSPLGPDFPLTHARIGYQNLLLNAGLTAAVGDPFAVIIPNTFERWQCGSANTLTALLDSPEPVDYVAIAAHNLGSTGATLSVQLDGTQVAISVPTDNTALMFLIPERSASEIKLVISNGDQTTAIGVVYAVALSRWRGRSGQGIHR